VRRIAGLSTRCRVPRSIAGDERRPDVFVEVFGDAGRHARMAIEVSALPYDVAVEVEGTFEVK
jgi:enamine deaminase RidA (YjgF/YER057c/UK114 family)